MGLPWNELGAVKDAMPTREPAVAGAFYPSDRGACARPSAPISRRDAAGCGYRRRRAEGADRPARGLRVLGSDRGLGVRDARSAARPHRARRAARPVASRRVSRARAVERERLEDAARRRPTRSRRGGGARDATAGPRLRRRARRRAQPRSAAAIPAGGARRLRAGADRRRRCDGAGGGASARARVGRTGDADRRQLGSLALPRLRDGALARRASPPPRSRRFGRKGLDEDERLRPRPGARTARRCAPARSRGSYARPAQLGRHGGAARSRGRATVPMPSPERRQLGSDEQAPCCASRARRSSTRCAPAGRSTWTSTRSRPRCASCARPS